MKMFPENEILICFSCKKEVNWNYKENERCSCGMLLRTGTELKRIR